MAAFAKRNDLLLVDLFDGDSAVRGSFSRENYLAVGALAQDLSQLVIFQIGAS